MTEAKRRFPMEGVEIWQNPKNKFHIFQLHYSADPDKRDGTYRDAVKSAMPIAQYNQEYELLWDSFEGRPVYQDYNDKEHGVEGEIDPWIGLPLLIGIDFGLTPALVVAQLQKKRLCVLREYIEVNMGAERFIEQTVTDLRIQYPGWSSFKKDFLTYIDPAGFARAQSNETTCAQYVGKHFNPLPGAIAWEKRKQSVEHFLTRRDKEGPLFKISKTSCPTLVRGFNGGYRYPESSFEVEPTKIRPLKDEHSHPHDGLQYICSGIIDLKVRKSVDIPRPSYGSKG